MALDPINLAPGSANAVLLQARPPAPALNLTLARALSFI